MSSNLYNEYAENQVIGMLLLNNDALNKIEVALAGCHFFYASYGKSFNEIKRLILAGKIADPITLKNFFDDVFEGIGGAKHSIDLIEVVIAPSMITEYAEIIFNLAKRRKLLEIEPVIQKIMKEIREDASMGNDEKFISKLTDVLTILDEEINSPIKSLHQIFEENIKEIENNFKNGQGGGGVLTGFVGIDSIGGFKKSDLIILAARPSMGKSALAIDIGYNAVKNNVPTLVISLEMSNGDLGHRILSQLSKISTEYLEAGKVTQDDFARFRKIIDAHTEFPLFFCDQNSLRLSKLRQHALYMHKKHNIGFIMVDYIGLMDAEEESRNQNKSYEIGELTKGLKALAKELKIPILALCQLNRDLEKREDKRPQLSDLRDSGSIEQDADVVMFLYREAYYLERKERSPAENLRLPEIKDKAEVNIAKIRKGEPKIFNLKFIGRLTTFTNE